MTTEMSAAIIGIQGYVGKELAKLVLHHPRITLNGVFARNSQEEVYQEMSFLEEQMVPVYSYGDIQRDIQQFEIVFLATPPEVSMDFMLYLVSSQKIVIDLSGAFRLTEEQFNEWYGISHSAAHLIDKFIYGLSPWWIKQEHKSNLIANPGCYATCALMSLIPLLRHEIINPENIIIDAKSGASGAGKKPKEDLLFCEISNNFFPYKIGKHQHMPEIAKGLSDFSNVKSKPFLITHMLPVHRGISMSIYANANARFESDLEIIAALLDAYTESYADYPLVKFGLLDKQKQTQNAHLLALKNVVGTAKVQMGFYVEEGRVFVFSSIDNLLKGAASQAIENINGVLGLPLHTGLQTIGNKI